MIKATVQFALAIILKDLFTEKNADFSLLFAVVTDNAFQGSKDSMLLQFKEISSILNVPMGTITWRYQSAIQKLRRFGYE